MMFSRLLLFLSASSLAQDLSLSLSLMTYVEKAKLKLTDSTTFVVTAVCVLINSLVPGCILSCHENEQDGYNL